MNICTSAHQPAFLPWLGYIQKLIFSKDFVIMDLAQFRKRSFMHRNRIEINDRANFIGLQISKKFDENKIKDINLSENILKKNIENIFFKIRLQYKNFSKYFQIEEFFDFLLNSKFKNFASLVKVQNNFFIKKFQTNTKVHVESTLFNLENFLKLNASEKLLEHAVYFKSKNYLSGENSRNYLDTKIFKKKNIENLIQNFDYSKYLNYQKTSEPLSIIHQLSMISYDEIKDMLYVSLTKDVKKF